MENNTEDTSIKSDNFKHALVKVAVATIASALARKFAEEVIDRMHDRRKVVAVETIAE
jgi:hypothetical protein